MDSVYVKLLAVFALLAAIRLVTIIGRVPARVRASVAEYTDSGILASVVAIFVVTFLLQISRVEGISMQPTLHGGEYTLVNKITYRWRVPQRGDVIVFQAPDNPAADYIKRVIATPGELVEVRNGYVYVNGEPLKEQYEFDPPDYDFPPTTVPPGRLFVLGDNRNRSFDSHLWPEPFLPLSLVHGKASVVIWPLARAGEIPGKPVPDTDVAVRHYYIPAQSQIPSPGQPAPNGAAVKKIPLSRSEAAKSAAPCAGGKP